MFWPKEWLPTEPGFKHVRLHSFGYSSDWTSKKESHLTVHHFGQALLADLHNSSYLTQCGEVRSHRSLDSPVPLTSLSRLLSFSSPTAWEV